jgi:hypothetical protein
MAVPGSGSNAARAQHQLRAGHADGAGYVHGRIFVKAPDIEDREFGPTRNQRRDFVGGQRRRVLALLDQFAKRLGVGIHVPEQLIARQLPALQSAVELANICVSQCHQAIRSL